MQKNDYVSLARVPMFDSGAWGIILNDRCTEGFVVVGYDSDDMKFRVNVRCELVDVIAPPKFKVGDKVKSNVIYTAAYRNNIVFDVISFKRSGDFWSYSCEKPDTNWACGVHENSIDFAETETA